MLDADKMMHYVECVCARVCVVERNIMLMIYLLLHSMVELHTQFIIFSMYVCVLGGLHMCMQVCYRLVLIHRRSNPGLSCDLSDFDCGASFSISEIQM